MAVKEMLCSEPAVPSCAIPGTPEQGCQLGLPLPGMHIQAVQTTLFLPAAQLELFLWEGALAAVLPPWHHAGQLLLER